MINDMTTTPYQTHNNSRICGNDNDIMHTNDNNNNNNNNNNNTNNNTDNTQHSTHTIHTSTTGGEGEHTCAENIPTIHTASQYNNVYNMNMCYKYKRTCWCSYDDMCMFAHGYVNPRISQAQ